MRVFVCVRVRVCVHVRMCVHVRDCNDAPPTWLSSQEMAHKGSQPVPLVQVAPAVQRPGAPKASEHKPHARNGLATAVEQHALLAGAVRATLLPVRARSKRHV